MKKGRYFTMRKILALVLAIVTLAVLAALPVSAALATGVYADGESLQNMHSGKAKFDGSTTNMSFGLNEDGSKKAVDLVVTEVMFDTTDIKYQSGGESKTAANCYNYIEIYNRGTEDVNLSNVAIVGITDQGSNSYWDNKGNFYNKDGADIKNAGGIVYLDYGTNIYDGNGTKVTINGEEYYSRTGLKTSQASSRQNDGAAVDNPGYDQMWLKPGQFAIVWLWSDVCVNASRGVEESLAAKMTGRTDNFPQFRDHYADKMGIQRYVTDAQGNFVLEGGKRVNTKEYQQLLDTLIVATYVNHSTSLYFPLTNHSESSSMIYALVDATYDRSQENPVQSGNKDSDYVHSNKIYSYFGWGTGGSRGITAGVEDAATIYVPSASTAELYHAFKLQEDADYDPVKKSDYLKNGIVQSYLEMAVFSVEETASIGSMPSYQWKYVDPARMETYAATAEKTALISDWEKTWDASTRKVAIQDATTGALRADWKVSTFEALKAERVPVLNDDGLDGPADENYQDIKNQNWYQDLVSKRDQKTEKEGLPIWALILIIVGSVLVAGGVAVLVIILVKKKKAAATAAWYAEHGGEIPADENAAAAAEKDAAAEAAADAAADDSAEEKKE